MSGNFLRFKRRFQAVRIFKSLIGGVSAGLFAAGICLVLSKLAVVGFEPFVSAFVGLGISVLTGVLLYFALGKTDQKLAEELDARFSLQEKVQTMVAYRGEDGAMLSLQRQDAEQALSGIPEKDFRTKHLWISILGLCIGSAVLVTGLVVKDKHNYTPPEEVKPFELTSMQIAGVEELIKYVNESEMDEAYKVEISTELAELLEGLKTVKTQPEMESLLDTSMTQIASVTYASSSMTEILTPLWNTEDSYIQALAGALNTSDWTEPEWGDFAEKYSELCALFKGQADASKDEEGEQSGAETLTEEEHFTKLKWVLDNTSTKVGMALNESGITADDPLFTVVNKFINEEQGDISAEHLFGLAVIAKNIPELTYDEALAEVDNTFNGMAEEFYNVIAQQKTNTNVGEYTMKKLAALFGVSAPAFERPEFADNSGGENSSEDDGKKPSDGGLGEGAVYGSNDLVLDPLTGEYVEYGTLLDKYYAVMYEKIDNGTYTDQQIEIIKNYFALLYSGIKEEVGN